MNLIFQHFYFFLTFVEKKLGLKERRSNALISVANQLGASAANIRFAKSISFFINTASRVEGDGN